MQVPATAPDGDLAVFAQVNGVTSPSGVLLNVRRLAPGAVRCHSSSVGPDFLAVDPVTPNLALIQPTI